jgi:hypothetical protein
MRHMVAVAVGSLMLGACGTVPESQPREPVPEDTQPAPPPANASFLPARTHIEVELEAPLGVDTHRIGDIFTARVAEAVIALNRDTVVPVGTVITGMVTGIDESDRAGEQAAIRLNFLRMSLRGVSHPFTATVLGTSLAPDSEPVEDATASAARGAVISGDLRTTLVSGDLGPGAGTVLSLGTGDVEAVLPAGTGMTIRTMDSLDLRR